MTATVVPFPRRRALTAEQRALVERDPDIARRAVGAVIRRYGKLMPPEDMLQEAEIAVVVAAQTHDPARGPFERWAFYGACHAILNAARAAGKHEALRRKARRAMLERLADGRGRPSDNEEELLDVFGIGADPARDTARDNLAKLCDDLVDQALKAAWQSHGEGAVVRREQAAAAMRALHQAAGELNGAQRTMLALRFRDDATQEEMAAKMGMSQRTMRRRLKELVDFLRARLAAAGITALPAWFGGEHGELFEDLDKDKELAGGA